MVVLTDVLVETGGADALSLLRKGVGGIVGAAILNVDGLRAGGDIRFGIECCHFLGHSVYHAAGDLVSCERCAQDGRTDDGVIAVGVVVWVGNSGLRIIDGIRIAAEVPGHFCGRRDEGGIARIDFVVEALVVAAKPEELVLPEWTAEVSAKLVLMKRGTEGEVFARQLVLYGLLFVVRLKPVGLDRKSVV